MEPVSYTHLLDDVRPRRIPFPVTMAEPRTPCQMSGVSHSSRPLSLIHIFGHKAVTGLKCRYFSEVGNAACCSSW